MKLKWLASIAVLLVLGSGVWWLRKHPASHNPTPSESSDTNPPRASVAASELAAARTPAEKLAALTHLRQVLTTGTTNEISAAIRALLDAKLEATTGQGFKVGAGGMLQEAPTLRTLLLNQLAMVDPAAATAYAKEILNTPGSPEEWAVALQALARSGASPDATDLLKKKTGELLRNTTWQNDPAVAYLEAFDTAVFLGGTNLLSPLSDLVRMKDNQAVAQAAFLALDRLVINQPAQTLTALTEHPEWMTGREQTRANYFARADVSDAVQRQLVETYLLDPAHGPAELQAFAGVFPNANFMISNNLITSNTTPDHATLAQRDRAALDTVNAWLAEARFANRRPLLLNMKARLEGFLK